MRETAGGEAGSRRREQHADWVKREKLQDRFLREDEMIASESLREALDHTSSRTSCDDRHVLHLHCPTLHSLVRALEKWLG